MFIEQIKQIKKERRLPLRKLAAALKTGFKKQ
jgi:hypothetical protein